MEFTIYPNTFDKKFERDFKDTKVYRDFENKKLFDETKSVVVVIKSIEDSKITFHYYEGEESVNAVASALFNAYNSDGTNPVAECNHTFLLVKKKYVMYINFFYSTHNLNLLANKNEDYDFTFLNLM
jgi:hypothetical protein